jgi:uncharacterized membrane protein YoaK (UPF0700 family)
MIRLQTRARLFAICLSAIAGFVDAVGYMQSGGFFVSFMSGNTTRLGVGVAGGTVAALLLAAFAMGAENATFEEGGEVRIGLTYMTGTLVKIGQRLAAAATGREGGAWLPYLQLWLGLVGGAALGTFAQGRLQTNALWIAAALTAGLALVAWRLAARVSPPA